MANNINIGVNISDNGSAAKTEQNVDKLQKKLAQAKSTADKLNVGGTAGSRAASQKADTLSNQGYRQAAGTIGKTGAGARDFAREAQGLGGLVRLYATYAANIFAVTAAFGALSRAMDTTNMIRGLDALGAASGQNLGQLSKRLVDATDGAISLQEAMKAVAQTSSAGMSSENIERLAKVAKSASLALGVAMPDAMSRLSRGVTKLEPELLDELGIMTKLDPAVQKYARQVGKSASQLTDFERRQAFANAVLEEGEQKFSALAEAAANPYDKLLASLKNVVQSGLEVINKVLGPLVELLSQNPTVLTTALLGVGVMLAKQALPALGEFKKGLQEAAKESEALYKSKVADAEAAKAAIEKLHKTQMDQIAAQKVDEVDAAAAKLGNLRKTSAAYKALQMDLDDLTEKEFKAIELQAKRTKDPRKAEDIRALGKTLKEASTAQADFFATIKDTATYTNTLAVAEKARISNIKQSLITQAAQTASVAGMRSAMILLKANIDAADLSLTNFQRTVLLTRGSFAALGGQIAAFGNKINAALGWVGMLATVVSLLDGAFSSNSKVLSGFANDLEAASSSAESAARTMEFLSKQEIITEYSISNVKALATAFNELSTRAEKVAKDAKAAKAAMSGWDKFKDFFYSFFNADLDTKIAATLSEQITSGLELVKGTGVGEKAQQTFTELLGGNIDPTNLEAVREKLKELSDDARQKVVTALKELNVVVGDSNLRLQGFSTALSATKTAFQDYITSTTNNDPLYKLGNSLGALTESMEKLKAGGINEIQSAFLDLRNSTQVLASLGPSFAKSFANVGQQFETNAANITKFNEQLANSKKEYEELEKAYNKRLSTKGLGSVRPEDRPDLVASITAKDATARNLKAQMEAVKNTADIIEANMVDAQTSAAEAGAKIYGEVLSAANAKSAEYLATATGNAAKAAKAIIDQAKLSGLTGEQRAREQNRLAEQQIQLDINAIQISIDLIKSQASLKASIDAATAQRAVDTAGENATDAEKNAAKITKAIAMVLGSKDGIVAALKTVPADIAQEVRYGVSSTQAALGGQNAALTIAQGKQAAQMRTGEMNIRSGRREDAAAVLQLEEQINTAIETRNNLTKTLTGNYDLVAVKTDQITAKEELIKKQQQEQAAYLDRILDATGNYAQEEKVRKEYALALKRQEIELENLTLEQRIQIANIDKEIAARDLAYLQQKQDIVYKMTQDQQAVSSQLLDLELQKMQAMGTYTQSYEAQKAYEMEVYTITENAKKAKSDALFEYQKQQALDLVNYEAAVKAGGVDSTQAQRISETMALEAAALEAKLSGIDAVKAKQLELKSAIKSTTDEETKFNKSIAAVKSLDKVFAGLGSTISSVAEAMRKYSKESDKNAKTVKTAQDRVDALELQGASIEQIKEAEAGLTKAKQEQSAQELENLGTLAGETKKLFAEKTAGYKLMSALEKAAAVQSAVIQAQALAQTLATLPAKIAGGISALFEQGGWAGFAGAAAFLAMLGSYGSSAKSAPSNFVPSAEQQQKVQGTAQTYDTKGNVVQTRRGVYGDAEAKLTDIANSIAIVEATSVAGLPIQNSMLAALKAIRDGITQSAGALYRISGLFSSGMSIFGTSIGSNGGSGFLGFNKRTVTRDLVDIGIILDGTFAEMKANALDTLSVYESVRTTVKKSSWWGLSSSTSTSTDTAVRDMMAWATSTNDSATIKAVVDFGTKVGKVFNQYDTLFKDLGDKLGISSQTIDNLESQVAIQREKFSTQGLKGTELADALSSYFASIIDDTTAAIFNQYEKFAKFGETMLETVVRVADQNMKLDQALKNIGIGAISDQVAKAYKYTTDTFKVSGGFFGLFSNISMDRSYSANLSAGTNPFTTISYETSKETLAVLASEINNTLVDMADGLDNFLTKAQYFSDNFLTLEERIAPSISAVNEALSPFNLSVNSTKEQFKQLLLSQNLLTKEGQQNYTTLMNVAEAFINVKDATKEITDNINTMQDAITRSGSAADITSNAYKRVTGGMTIFGHRFTWSYSVLVKTAEEMQQSLISAAGSLDAFVSQTNQFTNSFVSEEQRLAISQKIVKDTLKNLGISYIDSRKQLTEYIQGLDLSSEAAVNARQSVMNILDDLDTVYAKQEAVAAQRTELDLRIAELTKDTETVRKAELAALDSSNQELQKRIWLLEDQAAIDAEANGLQNTLNSALELTAEIRAKELSQLNEVNRVLQQQIYIVQDYKAALSAVASAETAVQSIRDQATTEYVSASDKVAAQQEKITNLVIEAAKKMRDFSVTLTDFIKTTLKGSTSENANLKLQSVVSSALSGDTSAISSVTSVAQAAIDTARQTSGSLQEFYKTRADILSQVAKVAKYTEEQASLVSIPDEDPMVTANNTLADLLKEQEDAKKVAIEIGASLEKSVEDLTKKYTSAQEALLIAVLDKETYEARAKQLGLDLSSIASDASKIDVNTLGTINALYDALLGGDSSLGKVINTQFSSLDTNIDGLLTLEELKNSGLASDVELAKMFKTFDDNSDARLTKQELSRNTANTALVTALNSLGTTLDTDKLTLTEFKTVMDGKASDTFLEEVFKQLDTNYDGLLSQAEAQSGVIGVLNNGLKTWLTDMVTALSAEIGKMPANQFTLEEMQTALSTKATADEVTALFKLLDADNDKLISAAELTTNRLGTGSTNYLQSVDGTTASSAEANAAAVAGTLALVNETSVSGFNVLADGLDYIAAVLDAINTNIGTIVSNTAGTVNNTASLVSVLNGAAGATGSQAVAAVKAVASGKSSSIGSFLSDLAGGVIDIAGNILKGVGDVVGGVVKGVRNLFKSIFSDINAKKNIKYASTYNGINLYDFEYKDKYKDLMGHGQKRGVLAQEIEQQHPGAVIIDPITGLKRVNYSMLPIPRRMLKFANGGVFTNNVIQSPTEFNTAVMGEAGPEAIMPLKRDSSGKLGVISTAKKPSIEAPATSTSGATNSEKALLNEIRALKEEVSLLRYEARATATSTNKTSKILERVTRSGESLLITDTATL